MRLEQGPDSHEKGFEFFDLLKESKSPLRPPAHSSREALSP